MVRGKQVSVLPCRPPLRSGATTNFHKGVAEFHKLQLHTPKIGDYTVQLTSGLGHKAAFTIRVIEGVQGGQLVWGALPGGWGLRTVTPCSWAQKYPLWVRLVEHFPGNGAK